MTTYFDMNLDLTAENKAIRDEAHKFAKEGIRPIGREIDKMKARAAVSKTLRSGNFSGRHTRLATIKISESGIYRGIREYGIKDSCLTEVVFKPSSAH